MLNTMFICIMDYITEENGGSQISRVHLPFSLMRVLSELVLQCNVIINSFQWMRLSPQRYESSCTSTKWMPSSFSFASIVDFFLHFGSNTEKCFMTFYKSSGLYFHSDCVFLVFILGFFENCTLLSRPKVPRLLCHTPLLEWLPFCL